MPLPRRLLGALSLSCAAAFACVAGPTGRQDIGLLAGSSNGADWRAYLAAAPTPEALGEVSPLEQSPSGMLAELRPPTDSLLATAFILADAGRAQGAATFAVEPRPFVDRTVRSDRLAIPHANSIRQGIGGIVTPVALYGMAARAASTPDGAFYESATPASGSGPESVASMPVEEPRPLVSFRLARAADETSGVGGLTSAERSTNAQGEASTRLAHVLLLPERELLATQKCLAEAVYFEARGEPLKGQYAVAQVVMNRTRSGFYPNTACKVVYQNRHRFNACQFSFACDRFADRVYNRAAWSAAQRIAKDVTENGYWLADVGGATHYHADYVRPYWAPKMIKLKTIGRHIFYRPRWLPDLGAEPAVSQAMPRSLPAQDS